MHPHTQRLVNLFLQVRSKVSAARALRELAADPTTARDEKDKLYAESAFMLLGALAHCHQSPDFVDVKEQRKWARMAVRCVSLVRRGQPGSGDPAVSMMIELYLKLQLYQQAVDVCIRK